MFLVSKQQLKPVINVLAKKKKKQLSMGYRSNSTSYQILTYFDRFVLFIYYVRFLKG